MSALEMLTDRNWLRRFRRNLRNWYKEHARDLPWRSTADPYRIWISEIMLQQTTVAAVLGYYRRFLRKFGTLEKLAAASEQDVLRCWEGLGYYSRARNIHKTARIIAKDCAGQFPSDVGRLMGLPGIGRYTAGAIASFAFDVPAPIVESNTLRLYCRLLGYRGDSRSSGGQRTLWDFAERIVPRQAPGRFNQALMDFGATVCTPDEPSCSACPLRSCCRSFAEGIQREIPVSARSTKVTSVTEAAVAIRRKNAYLLVRRNSGERWAGLWDFPRFELSDRDAPSVATVRRTVVSGQSQLTLPLKQVLEAATREATGINTQVDQIISEIKHSVTRYRIRLLCVLARRRSGRLKAIRQAEWVVPSRFRDFPLSATGRQLANLLLERDRSATR
jgi:A/G-specific adenine glycosylase